MWHMEAFLCINEFIVLQPNLVLFRTINKPSLNIGAYFNQFLFRPGPVILPDLAGFSYACCCIYCPVDNEIARCVLVDRTTPRLTRQL